MTKQAKSMLSSQIPICLTDLSSIIYHKNAIFQQIKKDRGIEVHERINKKVRTLTLY